jgi:hypothetical protein
MIYCEKQLRLRSEMGLGPVRIETPLEPLAPLSQPLKAPMPQD